MRKMRLFSIISIFLCVSFSAEAQCDSLRLEAALLQRQAYYQEDPAAASALLLDKARILLSAGEPQQASATLARVRAWLLDQTQLRTYRLLQEEAYYGSGEWESALSCIDTNDSARRHLALDALVMAANRRYDQSKALARSHIVQNFPSEMQDDALQRIDSLYRHKPRYTSQKAAMALSFLPPIGQAIAGHTREGFGALVTEAASAAFAVWQIIEGCYITGILGGGIMLEMAYMDNFNNTLRYTEEANNRNRAEFLGRLETILKAR